MTAETSGQISMSVGSGDHVDGSGGSRAEAVSEDHLLSVKKCETPRIGRPYYRMSSDPRGFCLIFNIFEFPHLPPDDVRRIRKGSEGEAKRLSQVFQQLHFKPEIIDNPKKEEIESVVEKYSKNPELKEHDCIVVIVLSHGRVGGFEASDGLYIPFKEIVEKLNNKNCLALINKPKLFFFSCCRGDNYDFGVNHRILALDDLNINAESDAGVVTTPDAEKEPFKTVLVPSASDIMICYSTCEGFVSWRCENSGSWLGLALCKALTKDSHNRDLLQMLTNISDAINDRHVEGWNAKQVIEIILRGFKKTFYFNPGYVMPVTPPVLENPSN